MAKGTVGRTVFETALKRKNITQAEVASAASIDPSEISKLCSGQRSMTIRMAHEIAPHLDVHPMALVADDPVVAVIGEIAAGKPLRWFSPQDPAIETPVPYTIWSKNLVGVMVNDPERARTHEHGTVYFFERGRTTVGEECVDRLCVVECDDGAAFIRIVVEERGGLYQLGSEIYHAFWTEINWASPVVHVLPRFRS